MHSRWPKLVVTLALPITATLAASPAAAQDRNGSTAETARSATPPIASEVSERLLALEPFVGRWVARGELSGGRRYTAERNCAWTLDKRYMRVDHTMTIDSVTVSEHTLIGWDPATNALRLWSFASDGSYAQGTEQPAPSENRWIFAGTTSGSRTSEWRVTTFLPDPGSLSILLEIRNGTRDLTPAMTIAYQRVSDAETQ